MGGSWTSTWRATDVLDVLDEESGCLGPRQPPELDHHVLSAMDLFLASLLGLDPSLPPWSWWGDNLWP